MSNKPMFGECECCNAETEVFELMVPTSDGKERRPSMLCDLCSSTNASAHQRYNRDDAEVLRALCYIGNKILANLRPEVAP